MQFVITACGGKYSHTGTCLSKYDIRIECCFASSRENTITFLGVPRSPVRTLWTKVFPMDPVPPVTTIRLPSKIIAQLLEYLAQALQPSPSIRAAGKAGPRGIETNPGFCRTGTRHTARFPCGGLEHRGSW